MKALLSLIVLLTISVTATLGQNTSKKDSLLVEYYQTQRFADAADYLKKLYPEPLTDSKIISQLAYSSNMAGRLADAEGYYKRLYNADSTNLSILFNMAGINFRRGNNQKALTYYKKILGVDSTNAAVYKQMALISTQTADIAGAITYLIKANRLNPEDANTAFDLATYLISLKSYEQADKIITRALQADTANLLLLKGKAQALYMQKKYAETITVCDKLMSNFDHSSQVITYKGVSHFALKDYNNCINTFKIQDSVGTQNETSYYYMGMAYKALKDHNKAIFYLQKAIKEGISDNTGTYYAEIGNCYDQLHQPKMALKAYQRGITFNETPMAYYAIGAIYDTDLRDTVNAIRYYRKYLQMKPPFDKQKSFIDFSKQRIESLHR
ncbi:hypothetical protein MUY27_09320 [Mucilaginibacter sp. RS28]|uniref:Tetratricopeptide repeat protein n=1 Tax=Mucilaginibacter straminoryzae TaxID=2932774 RepID=A0A9X1X5D8_9SPHI|nr:tetratricopeptide repeat protein [Mucilaginibacter straminoryzae]MCJ8209908.1 hypothetical protein [Mucilaginibacter straminoryzae]